VEDFTLRYVANNNSHWCGIFNIVCHPTDIPGSSASRVAEPLNKSFPNPSFNTEEKQTFLRKTAALLNKIKKKVCNNVGFVLDQYRYF